METVDRITKTLVETAC